jgi:4-carboxymuconolactone decarboxylase
MEISEKGKETFIKMFGEEYSKVFLDHVDELSPEMTRIAMNVLTPEIWALENMDMRTKILCAFSSLAALARPETEVFAYGAFYHGVTMEELTDVILVIGIEAGFPAAMEAFKSANTAYQRYKELTGRE